MHAAATTAHADQETDGESLYGLERLGDSHEWGTALLRLLELGGWTIDRRPGFAGDGVIVTGMRRGTSIVMRGETLADIAVPMFEAAMRSRPWNAE